MQDNVSDAAKDGIGGSRALSVNIFMSIAICQVSIWTHVGLCWALGTPHSLCALVSQSVHVLRSCVRACARVRLAWRQSLACVLADAVHEDGCT